ncbi:hypothetical protein K474DRAFT_1225883 [Panus rudis PR-1116 ss-1]|nr:hypothetical protein K474DRAFT_1225883 [Panus rudis PR-1116 ss-1]
MPPPLLPTNTYIPTSAVLTYAPVKEARQSTYVLLVMLPLGLKVSWFVLSLLGLVSNWVAFIAFARALRPPWLPIVYCTASTVLQISFCLGFIWRMRPSIMPRGFCAAQTVLI